MAAPEFLIQATQGWARLYGDSPMLSTGVRFVHLTGLLVAGGLALAADRATMLAAREDEAGRAAALRRLTGTHSVVLSGLVLLFASGAGLFLADVETYWDARVFWVKLTLIALLLANGLLMKQAEGFLAELGSPYAAIGADAKGRMAVDWGVYGVPETFLIDREGVIRFKHVGPLTPEVLASKLLPRLQELSR